MIFKLSFAVFWFFSVIQDLLFHTYLWQLKEYRLDRLVPHLRLKTSQKIIFSPLNLIKWGLVFLFFLVPISLKIWLVYLALIVFLVNFFSFFKQGLAREVFRPQFTLRMLEIILGSLLFFGLALLFLFWQKSLWFSFFILLVTERLVFLVVSFWVLLTKAPVFLSKRGKTKKAEERLKQAFQLKVIGVTGSYGKTSTKDFIAQILTQKYKVAKTQGTNNTKIGVVQNILLELKKKTEVFVVEMGAYKKGEIADICRLVRPDLAVVTGINEQHLAIFGDLKRLIKAKYEIVEALPKEGVAIFNGDNPHCLAMAKEATKKFKTIIYQTKKPRGLPNAIDLVWNDPIKVKKENLLFTVHYGRNEMKLEASSLAFHQIGNLLAAVAVAQQLGLTSSQIKKAVRQLQPSERAMRPVKGVNNITLIDDTFSSNLHGFLAALDYLRGLRVKNKVVITPGIIELGKASSQIHRRLGKAMQSGIDLIILTNDNFWGDIKKGVGKKTPLVVETNPQEIIKILSSQPSGTAVLLEGRLPVKVIKTLKNK